MSSARTYAATGRAGKSQPQSQPPASGPLLSVEDLTVSFTTARGTASAVSELSFHVDPGEVLAIVGESGSGKSVTAQAIMGLLPRRSASVDSGRVSFGGRDLLALPPRQAREVSGRDIGMVFQDPLTSLNPVHSVGRQIAEASRRRFGCTRREGRELAIEMLQRVRIPDAARRVDDFPHQFSGGMRQRVMIAMALATGPQLLIADEPTTALDVTVQAQIMELLAELQAERGMTMILITHDLGVVAEAADRVLVMYAGRAVETGRIHEVYDRSSHPYTAGLLTSLPGELTDGEDLVPIPGSPADIWDRPEGCVFAPRCARARDICTIYRPKLLPTADGSPAHAAACHFSEEVLADARIA